jgi:hypothetical protein
MKRFLFCAALLIVSTIARAENVFEGEFPCGKEALGCAASASPEIIAALKKRYPNAESIWAFDEPGKGGKRRYSVAFFTGEWHMA